MRTASLPATPELRHAFEFERRYGIFGGREQRHLPFMVAEVRDSGAGNGQYTVVGHAAVTNMWSLDLGFFREQIAPGAFDNVLARNPDVFHVWDHDTRYVLSRTRNKTLELSIDDRGLRMWSRVAPTTYAADLRVLMERGDIDQSSFAFTVASDEWLIETDADGGETISRTIIEIEDLYDVTTTAMGAYPQTDSSVARGIVSDYMNGVGRHPGGAAIAAAAPEGDLSGDSTSSGSSAGEDNEARKRLAALRATSRSAVLTHQHTLWRTDK